ncbi:unnamed protein product [Penicillium salamii]|uniref:Uncharacterized protein n=1 Tax=Penicillium salamii TaxID=1612424 RepID=A0A9W4NN82_9EURO|nr:unnamed protein product [Penicillium salamii]CAG8334968.1 unnamed protein product [Penicillium salamii]CAG8339805.1 unnamed protein product [Penicillium salamii]CAG8387933.1 unnamed protein product [Penicillium salamii]CAG8395369.1 unnamed protein product [Penicillium salamii]
MYEPATLSLHRLSRHSLQDRYESDEETVSESDAGAQDLLSSPVDSQREIFDSDLTDNSSHMDHDSDRDERLLSLPVTKRARPISTDTVKRNGSAVFSEDAYVLSPEEDMVLELPSPDSPIQLASSLFLQPSIYAAPKPRHVKTRSRSPSPSSVFSVEEADIQVAQKITFMEPRTRPTVVLINALGSRSKSSKSRPSPRSRDSSRPRPATMRSDSRLSLRPDSLLKSRVPLQEITNPPSNEDFAPTATISRVSDIPPVPYLPAPRTHPAGPRPRPRTSSSDMAMPPPLNVRTRRLTETRPPLSMRTLSTASITSRPTTPFSPEESLSTIHDHESLPSLTRTCSPVSIASSPAKRSTSSYSVSNILSNRSPLMPRRMTRKHSSSSVVSLSSLRSEFDPRGPASSQISVVSQPPRADSTPVRKSSQRRHLRHNSFAPSGRGFLGLKLGRKNKS